MGHVRWGFDGEGSELCLIVGTVGEGGKGVDEVEGGLQRGVRLRLRSF